MQKTALAKDDHELVKAACDAAKKNVLQIYGERQPPYVAAAVRLDNGEIITGVNLTTDVGSISMCAEPFAIQEANRREGRKITAIVAVYHQQGREPKVVPPCGRCREVIVDFAAKGHVILREPGSPDLYKAPATDLLPARYGDFWKDGELV
jgi:cytidine deaminase